MRISFYAIALCPLVADSVSLQKIKQAVDGDLGSALQQVDAEVEPDDTLLVQSDDAIEEEDEELALIDAMQEGDEALAQSSTELEAHHNMYDSDWTFHSHEHP